MTIADGSAELVLAGERSTSSGVTVGSDRSRVGAGAHIDLRDLLADVDERRFPLWRARGCDEVGQQQLPVAAGSPHAFGGERDQRWVRIGAFLHPSVLPSARGGSLLGRMAIRFGRKLSGSADPAGAGVAWAVIVTSVYVVVGMRAVAR